MKCFLAEGEGGEGSAMPGRRLTVVNILAGYAQSGAKDNPPAEYIWSQG